MESIWLPGMLYAAAKACPVWGGDVKSYDFDRIKNMPGVHSAVRLPFDALTKSVGFLGGGVAVVADSWWRAKTALDTMPIDWDYGPSAGITSASLYDAHVAASKEPGDVKTNDGNVDEAMGRAAKIVEAVYSVPFSPRARMEPGNATVLVTDNRVDIWSGDQDPQGLLLFSGPVETKEELDKVPAEVRQRYEKLQQNDLPAVISAQQSELDGDTDIDDEDSDEADIQSMNQISTQPSSGRLNSFVIQL